MDGPNRNILLEMFMSSNSCLIPYMPPKIYLMLYLYYNEGNGVVVNIANLVGIEASARRGAQNDITFGQNMSLNLLKGKYCESCDQGF